MRITVAGHVGGKELWQKDRDGLTTRVARDGATQVRMSRGYGLGNDVGWRLEKCNRCPRHKDGSAAGALSRCDNRNCARDEVCKRHEETLLREAVEAARRVMGRRERPEGEQERGRLIAALVDRARRGEWLELTCSCHPRRCHADDVARAVRELVGEIRRDARGSADASHGELGGAGRAAAERVGPQAGVMKRQPPGAQERMTPPTQPAAHTGQAATTPQASPTSQPTPRRRGARPPQQSQTEAGGRGGRPARRVRFAEVHHTWEYELWPGERQEKAKRYSAVEQYEDQPTTDGPLEDAGTTVGATAATSGPVGARATTPIDASTLPPTADPNAAPPASARSTASHPANAVADATPNTTDASAAPPRATSRNDDIATTATSLTDTHPAPVQTTDASSNPHADLPARHRRSGNKKRKRGQNHDERRHRDARKEWGHEVE